METFIKRPMVERTNKAEIKQNITRRWRHGEAQIFFYVDPIFLMLFYNSFIESVYLTFYALVLLS